MSASSAQSMSSIIKLTAMDITKFSGVYAEWSSFFDIFSALVHNNDALSDIQKYFYLRLSLSGHFEKAIQCYKITAYNYQLAF